MKKYKAIVSLLLLVGGCVSLNNSPSDGAVGGHGGAGTGGGGKAGLGVGGSGGAGGATTTCPESTTQCLGNAVQTCTGGQWTSSTCGARQTCAGPVGAVKCTCVTDLVCSSVGNSCASGSALVACAQDAQACFYQSSSSPCTDGVCSGGPGRLLLHERVRERATSVHGDHQHSVVCRREQRLQRDEHLDLPTGLVCERYGMATCVDPNWAEWPMPNGPADSAGCAES